MGEILVNTTDIDMEKALLEKQFDEVSQYISNELEYFTILFRQHKNDEIQKELDFQKRKMSHLIRREVKDNNPHFLIGKLIGVLEALDEYVLDVKENEEVQSIINESKIEDIPHIEDIIINIAKDAGIRHGKLAEKVGIEKNTLTSIMDKLVSHRLVTFSRPGKFKYYYLTSAGNIYFKQHLSRLETTASIDYLIEQTLLALAKDKNPSASVGKIMRALYAGKHKASGFKSEVGHKLDPLMLLPEITSIKPFDLMIPNLTNSFQVNQVGIYSIILEDKPMKQKVVFYSNDNSIITNTEQNLYMVQEG